jgi:uncharacterized protein
MSATSGSSARRRIADAGFLLDTRNLGRRPGSMREVRRTVTTPEHIGLDLIGVPAGSEIELDLRLQAVSEGVLVTGTASAPLAGECVRCLEPFADDIALSLTELFAYPDSATEQTTEEDEIYRLVDDQIDLEPVLVDIIGLALPLRPLCDPDCPGLCSECGIRLAIAGSDHHHEILDPRWAGLAAKFADSSPSDGLDEAHTTEEK